MNATLNRDTPSSSSLSNPARRLASTTAAVRVSFTWLGTRKTLSDQQKQQAAESFGAEGTFLSAAKKLLDTTHPAFKAVSSIRYRAIGYWHSVSLPYPEPGIRLIRQDRLEAFDQQMRDLREELSEAVQNLQEHYHPLKLAAQERLGSLYNRDDYPPSLVGLFSLDWDFPSIEAPQYLLQLSPELYEQEKSRVAARFEEAVQLAEQAFTAELARLVSHITERLSGSSDGQPKVFRDSCIENLREFFGRFKSLSVRSSADLERLVQTAQQAIAGVDPQSLRDSAPLRQQIATQLSAVGSVLDGLLVDRPRRRILRSPVAQGGG